MAVARVRLLAELGRSEPELVGKLGERLEEVLVRTGDTFCVYNSSR